VDDVQVIWECYLVLSERFREHDLGPYALELGPQRGQPRQGLPEANGRQAVAGASARLPERSSRSSLLAGLAFTLAS
jgi:hypothetical protein